MREGYVANRSIGEVGEQFIRFHVSQLAHEQVHGLFQQRIEIGQGADIRAVRHARLVRFQQKTERLKRHRIFFSKRLTQLIQVRGGEGGDADVANVEGRLGRQRRIGQFTGEELLKNMETKRLELQTRLKNVQQLRWECEKV